MKTDPRTLVHEVDKTTAPDLWPEIQGRRPGPPLPGPSNKSRLAAGALALVVAAGALTFGYQALRPADDTDRRHQAVPAPQPMPTGDPRVTTTIPLGPKEMAGGIAAFDGSVWVGAQHEDGSAPQVFRIDQATNEVLATIDVSATPWRGKIAASASGVWIASDGVLQRIDPASYEVTTVETLPGETITALAADDQSVWAVVVGDSGSLNDVNAWVIHLDLGPQTTTRIPLDSRAVGYDDEIRLSAGSVWVSGKELLSDDTERGGPIVRIDAATNEALSIWDVNAFDFVVAGDVVLVRTARDGVFDNHPNPEQWQVDRYDAETGDRIGEASRVNDGDLNGSLGADQSVMWGVGYDRAGNARVVRSDVETLAAEAQTEPLPSLFHDAVLDPESSTAWISAMNEVVRVDIDQQRTTPSEPPAELPGIDAYRVCRVLSLPGDFGSAGDEVVTFEEERVPGAGCEGSEGFQHLAILRDGVVTSMSARLTDLAPAAWRVWPYATPDLDGDGVDEIAVAAPDYDTTNDVWFFRIEANLVADGIVPIVNGAGPFHIPIDVPRPEIGDSGLYCTDHDGVREIYTWGIGRVGELHVVEARWRLTSTLLQLEAEGRERPVTDEDYPNLLSQELCGSPVSPRTAYPSAEGRD